MRRARFLGAFMQEHTNLRQPDASGAEPPKENMRARTFTAIGYLALLAALVVLKAFVPNDYGSIGFDALFCAISVIGAFEFMRALGGISAAQWWCAMVTCALTTPSFAIVKMIGVAGGDPNAWMYALLVLMGVGSVGAMVTAAMLVFDFEKSDLRSTTSALFCILYCGVLCSVSSNINHMGHNSLVGITLMFCTTVAVDTFALVFGKLFGRFLPLKLAPHTSPNKTVIGAFGGMFGGVLAAIFVWGLGWLAPQFRLEYSGELHALAVLVLVSLPTSIFAQLGDLFESAIKRGCGIKDMGKLLPGHGGVLDRFDSMLFASVAVVICFMMIH